MKAVDLQNVNYKMLIGLYISGDEGGVSSQYPLLWYYFGTALLGVWREVREDWIIDNSSFQESLPGLRRPGYPHLQHIGE